jgi:hypothetical protein
MAACGAVNEQETRRVGAALLNHKETEMALELNENLDAINDADDLQQLHYAYYALSRYAWNKMMAVRLRRVGSIDVARRHEAECDNIYRHLPDWARSW